MSDIKTYPMQNSAILRINAEEEFINTSPDYQRNGEIWTLDKRQLLIDSIQNDFHIPKIYFHELPDEKDKKYDYAIIDGRQRLETIWSFIKGEFPLASDFLYFKDESVEAGGLTYPDLAKKYPRLKIKFDSFTLPIILVSTDDLNLIDDMFSRLNEAVPLNAAEKRNAIGGQMVKVINTISNEIFFKSDVKFTNNRYQHREVSIRLLFIEYSLQHSDKLIDTKKPYLDSFVENHKTGGSKNISETNVLQKKVISVVKEMHSFFIEKDPLLRSQSIVPIIYLLIRAAIDQDLLGNITRSKFIDFKNELQENRKTAEKDITNANFDLLEYDRMSQQGTNDASSIKERFKIMAEYFKIVPQY